MLQLEPSPQKKALQRLAGEIKTGDCVLFLGPEIVEIGGRSFHHRMREILWQQNPEDILYYYDRDGFFLFKDELSKKDVRRVASEFLKETLPDESIYRKIARIPFHLIISVNPDTHLSTIYKEYGIVHQTAYFTHTGTYEGEEIEAPTAQKPLLYNLCGSASKRDSLVLDYDDLFKLIQTSFSTPGLPDRLRTKLNNATTFLFVGFQFEKWHTQLLIRLLTGDRRNRKYAIDVDAEPDASEEPDHTAPRRIAGPNTFLMEQFKLEFKKREEDFFTQVFLACENEGLLRKVLDTTEFSPARALAFLACGDLTRAVKVLGALTKGTAQEDAFILLSNQYHQWNQQHFTRTEFADRLEVSYNKLVLGLTDVAHALTQPT